MKKLKVILPMAALTAALAMTGSHARADEEAELKALPAAVQKTTRAEIGKSDVEEVEDTYEEGEHATEVEYRENGKKMAVVIAKDGRLIQKEYRMSVGDAPAGIVKAVQAFYPSGTITHIKEVMRKDVKFYEVAVKANGKSHELKLGEDGMPVNAD